MDNFNKKEETARLFFEVSRMLKQCMRKSFESSELTMPQSVIAFTLIKFGKMKISDLSDRVNLSNSTVSGIVDRLEKQGYVERVRSEEDRRTVYVNVTDEFQEIHKGFHKNMVKNFEDMLSSGTPEQMEKINEGLGTLKTILIKGMEDNKK